MTTTKAKEKVGRNDLCPCGSNKKYKKCCELAKDLKPSTCPISDMIIGQGEHGEIRGVSELYLPSIFDSLHCLVKEMSICVNSFRQMTIKANFLFLGDKDHFEKNLYKNESWKIYATENFFRTKPVGYKNLKKPLPFFALMLNKSLQVISAKLNDGNDCSIVFDSSPDIIITPNSHPPLTRLPSDKDYIYYDKKTTAFYTDLELDKEYFLEVELESCGVNFEFAPFFPVSNVKINEIKFENNSNLGVDSIANLVIPQVERIFPNWLEYKFQELLNRDPYRRSPPLTIPAHPFRGKMPLFDINKDTGLSGITSRDKIPDNFLLNTTDIKNLELVDYKTIRFCFLFMIGPERKFDISVRTLEGPLPIRIYEQIQNFTNYQDVLIEYDIINLDVEEINFKIETEITDYTNKSIDEVKIAPINNGKGEKARKFLQHCPRLKKDVLEQIVNSEKACIYSKITDLKSEKVVFEKTYNITLLPKDQMIWELNDLRSNTYYNLRDFVCAWVKPNDKEGLLDKVRAEASRFHKNNSFGFSGQRPTYEEADEYLRSIYSYLSTEGFNYVNRPFTSIMVANSQRIVNPETVIKNKSGNCIDLTVLFASILEGLGIYSLILIMPGHAFIGWGDTKDINKMIFLETTTIGRCNYEEAKKIARENFIKNFIFVGSNNHIMSNEMTFKTFGSYIVNLESAREEGIISMIN
ncbi:MAG: SEC-C metal-binding domain-containing protein [Patescibacteria group bacterium]